MNREMLRELGLAWRSLRRSRIFALTATIVLGVGIGTTTAALIAARSVYGTAVVPRTSGRAVRIYTGLASAPEGDYRRYGRSSYPDVERLRTLTEIFRDVAATARFSAVVDDDGAAVAAALVSGGYFADLDVGAELGRLIGPEDDSRPGADAVVVLSDAYWRSRFGADRAILGRVLRINGHPFTVIGVASPGFRGTSFDTSPSLCVPISMQAQAFGTPWVLDLPDARMFDVLGFLRSGIDPVRARHGVERLASALADEGDPLFRQRVITVEAADHLLASAERSRFRIDELMGLLGAVAALLYVAVATNLTGLSLARAVARRRDLAIRSALGASRRAIVRQQIAEHLVIALPAAAIGGIISLAAGRALSRVPFLTQVLSLDPAVHLLVAFAVGSGSALVIGAVSGWRATPATGRLPLRESASVAPESRSALRRLLVGAQVALAIAVTYDAMLLARSLRALLAKDPGYALSNVLAGKVQFSRRADFDARSMGQYDTFMQRLRELPGVMDASSGYYEMLTGVEPRAAVAIPGYAFGPREDSTVAFESVGLRYFSTLGIRIVRGRDFQARDTSTIEPPVIVNETMARRFWPASSAVGGVVVRNGVRMRVIGVASDVAFRDIRDDHSPRMYTAVRASAFAPQQQILYVRVRSLTPAVVGALRELAATTLPGVPPVAWRTLAADRDVVLLPTRLLGDIASGVALIAGALAALGLAGLTSFLAIQRRREIGVRRAIGASRASIVRLLLGDGIALTATGVAFGALLAAGSARLTSTVVYGVAPLDPMSLIVSVAIVALVTLVGGCVPAVRASGMDPLSAMRADS